MSVLAVTGLEKRYGGVCAVDGVSFSVDAGERVALIGPNGAGKSTCFSMIGGQVRPDRGQVLLDGADVTGAGPRRLFRASVGRTFQITTVFGSMSVIENVQTAFASHARRTRRLLGLARNECVKAAGEMLERTGLGAMAHEPCAQLAYGDLKRLELALALANEPRLLLMDEPTAGMAPGERHDLMALVTALARERNVAVLFTEHDMDIVFGHADRLLVLDRGRLVAQGEPEAVRNDPEVRRIYLGEDPH